jgi:hypothetical protein
VGGRQRWGKLPLGPHCAHHHRRTRRHHHEGGGLRHRLLGPAGPRIAGGLHVETPRPCPHTPAQERQSSPQAHGFDPFRLLQKEAIDYARGLHKGDGRLYALRLFVGPPHVLRPRGQLSRWGHSRQPHATAGLVPLAGDDLSPRGQRALQSIPQRFDQAWRRGTRPSRAIRGTLLDHARHPVLRTLQRPSLCGGGLGIRVTARRLLRRLAYGGVQRRI